MSFLVIYEHHCNYSRLWFGTNTQSCSAFCETLEKCFSRIKILRIPLKRWEERWKIVSLCLASLSRHNRTKKLFDLAISIYFSIVGSDEKYSRIIRQLSRREFRIPYSGLVLRECKVCDYLIGNRMLMSASNSMRHSFCRRRGELSCRPSEWIVYFIISAAEGRQSGRSYITKLSMYLQLRRYDFVVSRRPLSDRRSPLYYENIVVNSHEHKSWWMFLLL